MPNLFDLSAEAQARPPTRIRKALKTGRELPGVSLGEPKEQVRIE